MAGTIRIRSTKGLKKICGKLIGPKWESVDLDKFMSYKGSRMGAIVIKDSVEIYSDKNSSKKLESAEVRNLKAVRQTDKKRITGLEEENSSLKAKIVELEGQLVELSEQLEGSGDEDDVRPPVVQSGSSDDPFIFNPEIHTIEHKGRGSYFVMDQNDDKVYGPLSEEEKANFNAMLED